MLNDLLLWIKIKNDDIKAFEKLFRLYYAPLCRYADSFLNDTDTAEEIVQELFYELWKERSVMEITVAVRYYLFRSVRNRAFHYLKHMQVRKNYIRVITGEEQESATPHDELEYRDLEHRLVTLLDKLPDRQRKVFCLNRFNGKKYHEIAEELAISVKTVEADMSKVLSVLREGLMNNRC